MDYSQIKPSLASLNGKTFSDFPKADPSNFNFVVKSKKLKYKKPRPWPTVEAYEHRIEQEALKLADLEEKKKNLNIKILNQKRKISNYKTWIYNMKHET